jgi:transposase InsO family protein
MAEANRLWGAPRIHGELLKLGIDVSQATVARYMARHRRPPSQQLREAFPEDAGPRYLIHDRDHASVALASTASGMGIQEPRIAPRSPWQNGYAQRVIGSIRRECLDHVIVVNETGLSRVLSRYLAYYHQSQTHLSLAKDTPQPRPVANNAWPGRSHSTGRRPTSPYDRRAA